MKLNKDGIELIRELMFHGAPICKEAEKTLNKLEIAMEKQEQMKPVIEQGAPSYYGSTGICRDYCGCPKCGEEVGRGDDKANYCPECGQKIDWMED